MQRIMSSPFHPSVEVALISHKVTGRTGTVDVVLPLATGLPFYYEKTRSDGGIRSNTVEVYLRKDSSAVYRFAAFLVMNAYCI